MSQFSEGDRVFHRQLRMAGTYVGRHNWGTTSPETSSYVLFDDDDADYPDGRPVTTAQLDLLDGNGEPQ